MRLNYYYYYYFLPWEINSLSGKVSRCLVVGRYGRVRLPENKSAGFITTRALKKHCRALPSKVHRNRERERK